MRIIVLSNFYPPYVIGGMEHRCQEVVNGLRARGHEICVLTSTYGMDGAASSLDDIHRVLSLEGDMLHYRPLSFFVRRRRQDAQNIKYLKRAIDQFAPDIVFVWGMWNLSRNLAYWAEQWCPGRVVYSLAHDWPLHSDIHTSFWREPAHRKLRAPIKRLLAQVALNQLKTESKRYELQFKHAICVSQALYDDLIAAGISLADAQVIYPGINMDDYCYQRNSTVANQQEQGLSLLYAGTLAAHKGVQTAIEAMGLLLGDPESAGVYLTILGSGHPDYVAELRAAANALGVQRAIRFVDQVQREQMPTILKTHEVLIFPSIWEEPLSRVVLEAMAAGLVITATTTGGMKEILVDGVNALVFEPQDAVGLARLIRKLERQPELREALRGGGYATASRFTVQRMLDEIEQYLIRVVESC